MLYSDIGIPSMISRNLYTSSRKEWQYTIHITHPPCMKCTKGLGMHYSVLSLDKSSVSRLYTYAPYIYDVEYVK